MGMAPATPNRAYSTGNWPFRASKITMIGMATAAVMDERHIARENRWHQEDGESASYQRRESLQTPVLTCLALELMYSGQLCPAMTASPQSTTTRRAGDLLGENDGQQSLDAVRHRHHDHRSPPEGPLNVCAAGLAAAMWRSMPFARPQDSRSKEPSR
jgi:hypothetical protein